MRIWIGAQRSPALAQWISAHFKGIEAIAVRELGLREAEDVEIFHAAGSAGATILSKDADFVDLVNQLGAPPRVLWIRCGNTSNRRMHEILSSRLVEALELLNRGESLVEIGGT